MSILYILLAILGLGFLIFIHELGHYFMAKKVGMKVEAFGIGFGKPIYSWTRKGVQWRICILPFGGYVKIAGMQKEKGKDPYDIPDGFFGSKPFDRIKVAIMGPLVNVVFAIVGFSFIWISGGRDKFFHEFSNRIGWVDPASSLYKFGVRPGDEITKYDHRNFQNFKDIAYASISNGTTTSIQGYKINYFQKEKTGFEYNLFNYKHPDNPSFSTIGAMAPASYLIYDRLPDRKENPLEKTSPMMNSGIRYKDRIIWVDGELIFSLKQLHSIINQSVSFLTVQREEEIFQTRVARIPLKELSLSNFQSEDMRDWIYEMDISSRFEDVYFLPYVLTSDASVISNAKFIDEVEQEKIFENCKRCTYYTPLQKYDRILAVNGVPVSSSKDVLEEMQKRKSLIIVEEDTPVKNHVSWKNVNKYFDRKLDFASLEVLISEIGINASHDQLNKLRLLKAVTPKSFSEIYPTYKYVSGKDSLFLGIQLQDKQVLYNPNPITQFNGALSDTWFTLSGLFSGNLHPKFMSGPVGIVHVVQASWSLGIKEALFWLSLISLNLAVVNLLPIPVLDGGHITFSLYEIITKKRVSAKAMERLVIPFVVLLISLFIYITYNDIMRVISKFL